MIRIYGLRKVDSDLVYYVGRTRQTLRRRLNEHRWYSCARRLTLWIASLPSPHDVEIVELEVTDDENAAERESYWIQRCGERNPDLCNAREWHGADQWEPGERMRLRSQIRYWQTQPRPRRKEEK